MNVFRRTITRIIEEIAINLHDQVKDGCTDWVGFSLALDESNDVKDTAQLLIFIRTIHGRRTQPATRHGSGCSKRPPAITGTFTKSKNRVEEWNEAPGQPRHLLHSVKINSEVATIVAIDWAGSEIDCLWDH